MRKAVRRIFIGAAFVAGLLLLAIPLNSMRQTAALKRYEEKLRKAGEKLDYHDLIPVKPATNETGAPALLVAIDKLDEKSPLNGLGRLMGFVAPGKAMSLSCQPEVVSRVSSDFTIVSNAVPASSPFWGDSYKEVTNSREALLLEVRQNREALRGIEDALKSKAFDFGFNYGPLHFLESQKYLAHIKSGALWFQSAALIEMHRGDRPAAIECIRKIITLSDVLKDKNTRTSFLVRTAIIRIGLTATWEILQMPDWNESELRQLQTVWEAADFSKDLVQYLEMDRALYISTFDALFDNNQSVRKVVFASDVTNRMEEFVTINAVGNIWMGLWGEQDKLRYLQHSQNFIETARRCLTNHSALDWAACSQKFESWAKSDTFINYLKSGFTIQYLYSLGRDGAKYFQTQTFKEMAIAAIAVKRNSLRYGKFPTTLKHLVPEFLTRIPTDYMDGKPLRYLLKAGDNFLLYSVGLDGMDDGGDASPIKDELSYTFWTGRDAVWPETATSDEIAAHKEALREKWSALASSNIYPAAAVSFPATP